MGKIYDALVESTRLIEEEQAMQQEQQNNAQKNNDWKKPGKYFKTLGFSKDKVCKWKILDVDAKGRIFYIPANQNAEEVAISVGEPLGYDYVADTDILKESFNK